MGIIEPYSQWKRKWMNHRDNYRGLSRAQVALELIPFDAEPLPENVQQQYVAWHHIVQAIVYILDERDSWSQDIDETAAAESLKRFKNLMCAEHGLVFHHLTNYDKTAFPRLGPCAVVSELNDAIISTQVTIYAQWFPMKDLRDLIKQYKKLLQETDPHHKRDYDKTIRTRSSKLTERVNTLWIERQDIIQQLGKLDPDNPQYEEFQDLLIRQGSKIEDKERQARETAHFYFQFQKYINARYYGLDIDKIDTPMENWTPPDSRTPRAVPTDSSSQVDEPPGNLTSLATDQTQVPYEDPDSPTDPWALERYVRDPPVVSESFVSATPSATTEGGFSTLESVETGPSRRPPIPLRPASRRQGRIYRSSSFSEEL